MNAKQILVVKSIIKTRDSLKEVKKLRCTCSSFVFQTQGCSCDKGIEIRELKNKLNKLIEEL